MNPLLIYLLIVCSGVIGLCIGYLIFAVWEDAVMNAFEWCEEKIVEILRPLAFWL